MVDSTIRPPAQKREERSGVMRATANHQAKKIREYWIKQGYLGIEVSVVSEDCADGRGPLYKIVTNVRESGWPPKEKPLNSTSAVVIPLMPSEEYLAKLNKRYTTGGNAREVKG